MSGSGENPEKLTEFIALIMNLSKVKLALTKLKTIGFKLPDGTFVPNHFHVTEVGRVTKHFIDCGGTVRNEEVINFQLWNANDYDHRLHPEKLLKIIELSEKILGLKDAEIEVEYQGESIQKYGLEFDGTNFLLTTKHTDCLAKETCGKPVEKEKSPTLQEAACCAPGANCC